MQPTALALRLMQSARSTTTVARPVRICFYKVPPARPGDGDSGQQKSTTVALQTRPSQVYCTLPCSGFLHFRKIGADHRAALAGGRGRLTIVLARALDCFSVTHRACCHTLWSSADPDLAGLQSAPRHPSVPHSPQEPLTLEPTMPD